MSSPRAKPDILTVVAALATSILAALGPFLAKPVNAQSARDALEEKIAATRFEQWLIFQRNIDHSELVQYWPRFFIPFDLPSSWRFTQRIDLPFAYTDSVGPQNPSGNWKSGINDWFIEEIFTTPEVAKNTTLKGSVRFVFPTGGQGPFGHNQYEWAPAIGATYRTPERELTIHPLVRYFWSYHASEAGASEVRTLNLFPTVTWAFSHGWALSFFGENPIVRNDVTHKWFVPIDALLLKQVRKDLDFTVGGAYGMVTHDPLYRYIINASVAFHF